MRILITGKNSYVGHSLKEWLRKWPGKYHVETVSLRGSEWRQRDLSTYDVIFHTAAIVHEIEKPDSEKLYYEINSDLTIELAKKAKSSGVKKFLFMSSMSVYGLEGKIGTLVKINESTPCKPTTFYGKSKLQAEQELMKLNDSKFVVAIIRSPIIYGPNCPGNYQRLKGLVLKFGVLPDIQNHRSMIYIDHHSELIRLLLDDPRIENTVFCPQDEKYVTTIELGKEIASCHKRRLIALGGLHGLIKMLFSTNRAANKAFGNLVYDAELSTYYNGKYRLFSFKEAIARTEMD